MNKQIKKRCDKVCFFCGESDYDLLDLHRILEGSKGGAYTEFNCVTCCCKCHRKIHAGKITVYRWCLSTNGYVLHYVDEDGSEKFKKRPR